MKRVSDSPIIYSKIISNIIPSNFKEDIIKLWNEKKPYENYTVEYNQSLLDHNNNLNPLYDVFLQNVKSVYDRNLIEKRKFWLYLTNDKWGKTHWHNHKDTASIVGVYYVQVDTPITFENITYQPQNNELLIFSSEVNHKPIPSKNNRISINMEVL